jgi:Putative transposase/Transposase zinc-binding domain
MGGKMPLIQDIFKQYGGGYLEKYGEKMPSSHKKALLAMIECRSKSLGGETYFCKKCNQYHYSYHSCGNRHCAVCGNDDAGKWIAAQRTKLLPFTYFLATFTIPEQLRALCRANQKLFYGILFRASSTALKALAGDKKYLGAQIGMTGILHTWSRALAYHPHVHYLVPGGGITDEMKKVRFSEDNFLVHVRPLSIIFKAKFRDTLKAKAPDLFNKIRPNTWKRAWVVHIKAVGNGEKALGYMGRYLFRVAIGNNRILKLQAGKVTFRYTDYKTGKTKTVTVDVLEFIRRFLQHVLPHNFMKVRYYGFLAAASRKKLTKLRKMLYLDGVPQKDLQDIAKTPKVILCPVCGNPLQWIEKLPKSYAGHLP